MSWPGKLAFWLREVLCSDRYGKFRDLTRLELHSQSRSSLASALSTVPFDADTEPVNPDELAEEFRRKAEEDSAESLEDQTRYTVKAFYENREEPSATSPPFVIQNAQFEDYNRYDRSLAVRGGEGGAVASLNAQLMKHNEVMTKLLVANTAQIQSHNRQMLEAAFKRIEELETDRIDAIKLVEQISNESHNRELEGKRETAKLGRQQEAWESFKVLAPTLVNKFAGKHLLPQKITPKDEIVHTLIASLTPEQIEALKSVFTPPQIIGFAELYEMEAKEDERRKAEEEEKKRKMDQELAARIAAGGSNGSN